VIVEVLTMLAVYDFVVFWGRDEVVGKLIVLEDGDSRFL
jgi:hypothetical protein